MEHTGNKTENTKATALITAVHRERYEILVEQETPDTKLNARLKTVCIIGTRAGAFPTVGDRVRIQTNRCGDALILETLPRTSVFYQENPTPGMERQAVAANFDYVFLVMSMNHDFNQNRLDRYLTAAWESRATPVVILTKKDLCEEPEYYVNLVERQAQGVAVCAVSAVMGEGWNTCNAIWVRENGSAAGIIRCRQIHVCECAVWGDGYGYRRDPGG